MPPGRHRADRRGGSGPRPRHPSSGGVFSCARGFLAGLVLDCRLHLLLAIHPLHIRILLTKEISVSEPRARNNCQLKLALAIKAGGDWVYFIPYQLCADLKGTSHFVVVVVDFKQVLVTLCINCQTTERNWIRLSYQVRSYRILISSLYREVFLESYLLEYIFQFKTLIPCCLKPSIINNFCLLQLFIILKLAKWVLLSECIIIFKEFSFYKCHFQDAISIQVWVNLWIWRHIDELGSQFEFSCFFLLFIKQGESMLLDVLILDQ